MHDDDRREIFERLEALERLVRSRLDEPRHGRRHGDHDRDRNHRHHHRHDGDHGGSDFDEKRIVDLIVHLVSEQVGRIVQDEQAHARGRDDGGGEKRIVDLIVGLVAEHVQEIVATELDRRFGPTPNSGNEARPPSPPPIPPRRGDPDPV